MRWKYNKEVDLEKVNELSKTLNDLPLALSKILVCRGIDEFDKAKTFFRPSMDDLLDPFLMKDMQKAVERIEKAIDSGEKVLIYGDYDVDGTTAVSLVYDFLKKYTQQIDFYIPDRYSEGYGISFQGIDFASENGFTLVIALDCGIKAVDKMEYANEKGIDFIICDHHLPGEKIPNAFAVLDPQRSDSQYPFKGLSGCGVGFKLLQAFCIHKKVAEKVLMPYLDLLAISIAADIVPIVGENRILAYYGLEILNKSPRPGVKSLIELAAVKRELTISDVVFYIAPRINAAGRIETGRNAVEALISEESEAAEKSIKINLNNRERKDLDKEISEEAIAMIEEDSTLKDRKSIVLYAEHWHKGVVGIVASRVVEKFYRPTIILTQSNGEITGSARSVKYFNVYNAIDACKDILERYGGHKYAAGLTLLPENLEKFQAMFEKAVSESIEDDWLIPELEIDSDIEFSEVNDKFIRILKQIAPFGPGNPKPIFVAKNLKIKDKIRVMAEKHLKFEATQDNEALTVVYFNGIENKEQLESGKTFDLAFHVEENIFRGNRSIQLITKGIKFNR